MSQQKSRKKTISQSNRDRVVYEIKGPYGSYEVTVENVAGLKLSLMDKLGLEPYSAQALAQIVHVERATVQGPKWSVKRLGILTFVPDEDSPVRPPSKTPKGQSQEQESSSDPTTQTAQSG